MALFLKLLAKWCCKPLDFDSFANKDSTTISEQPDKQLEELRTEIKSMLQAQHGVYRPAGLEDVVVEVDYLPVYEEKEGKLQFAGSQTKILFSEVRIREAV